MEPEHRQASANPRSAVRVMGGRGWQFPAILPEQPQRSLQERGVELQPTWPFSQTTILTGPSEDVTREKVLLLRERGPRAW